MDVEKVSRKKNGKNGAPRKSSNLDQYIAEQEEKVQMNEEAAGMSSFDSLRTALLQCIQVRDHELLKALLQNDDEETIENTVADLPASSLEQFINILAERMMNDPAHSRHSVRWLKLTLKGNMNTIVSLPEALGTLRGCQSFIKKKEEMLPTVMKMKGKLELALAMRQKKRDVERDALDIENMKPLVTIRGGEIVTEKPNNLEEEEESVGAQEMLEEDDLDDELDDELDEDEKLYQEAYENEELEEGIEEGEEEDGDVEEDEN